MMGEELKPGECDVTLGPQLLALLGEDSQPVQLGTVCRVWLGEHRASQGRLFQRLREVRGLNYGNYAYIEAFPQGMYQFFPDPNLGRRAQIFEVWIRPVAGFTRAGSASTYVPLSLEISRYSSRSRGTSCSGASVSRTEASVE